MLSLRVQLRLITKNTKHSSPEGMRHEHRHVRALEVNPLLTHTQPPPPQHTHTQLTHTNTTPHNKRSHGLSSPEGLRHEHRHVLALDIGLLVAKHLEQVLRAVARALQSFWGFAL